VTYCKEGVLKKLAALTIVPLLLMSSLSSLAAQSVGDLLKLKIKIAVDKQCVTRKTMSVPSVTFHLFCSSLVS
jgi:hypothetical protein